MKGVVRMLGPDPGTLEAELNNLRATEGFAEAERVAYELAREAFIQAGRRLRVRTESWDRRVAVIKKLGDLPADFVRPLGPEPVTKDDFAGEPA